MTLQERIESFATMSATMLAQLNELSALHEKVRLAYVYDEGRLVLRGGFEHS
jgi:hypothetical protein